MQGWTAQGTPTTAAGDISWEFPTPILDTLHHQVHHRLLDEQLELQATQVNAAATVHADGHAAGHAAAEQRAACPRTAQVAFWHTAGSALHCCARAAVPPSEQQNDAFFSVADAMPLQQPQPQGSYCLESAPQPSLLPQGCVQAQTVPTSAVLNPTCRTSRRASRTRHPVGPLNAWHRRLLKRQLRKRGRALMAAVHCIASQITVLDQLDALEEAQRQQLTQRSSQQLRRASQEVPIPPYLSPTEEGVPNVPYAPTSNAGSLAAPIANCVAPLPHLLLQDCHLNA